MPTVKPLARDVIARRGVLIIGHRGASFDAPENTVPAFRLALEHGADLVELDYRHTKDGVPVVFHDKTLDRTTDAEARFGGRKLPLADRAAADLTGLDAGVWFDERYRGARIPTLEAALDVIQAGAVTLIERKAGDAATLTALLRRRGESAHVVVQAFNWDFLADCARRDPSLVLGALGKRDLTKERLDTITRCGARVVGWSHKHIDAAAVAAVHARGLKLWVYTVNDPRRARALVAMGVDGLITDRPRAIRAALTADAR